MDPNILLSLTFLAVLVLETVVGLFANIFIIFVICVHSRKRRDANPSDVILVALAIASLCQISMLSFNILSNNVCPEIYKEVYVNYIVLFLTQYSDASCVWLTACLCFFYFSKITTFTCPALRWVKRKINTVVNWLILASQIASAINSFPILIAFNKTERLINDHLVFTNSSSGAQDFSSKNIYYIYYSCVPIFIIIITTASSVVSLNLHAQKMEKNISTISNGNLQTYRNIVHNMICLLLFYVTFYVSLFLFAFEVFPTWTIGYWVILVVLFSLTPVQSVFLIVVTYKLKDAWMSLLKHTKEKIFMCLKAGL